MILTLEKPPEEKPVWKYQNERVCILPFGDGSTFPEEFLVWLYGKVKREGNMAERILPDTTFNLNQFIDYFMKHPPLIGALRETNEIIGFAWLNEIYGPVGGRRGSLGFGFFKKYWGTDDIRDCSRFFLQWWFEELKIDVMFGNTLKTNLAAQAFSREMGFQKVADIPKFFTVKGKMATCTLLMLEKQDFLLSRKTDSVQ